MKSKLALLTLAAYMTALPSCTITPEQQASLMKLSDAGVATGALQPGHSALIKEGVVVFSEISNAFAKKKEAKEVPLAESGFADAVKSGKLSVGDTVTTYDGVTATVIPSESNTPAAPVPKG